jgi:dienelactone hydrolase
MLQRMPRGVRVALVALLLSAGCSTSLVRFPNATPGAPLTVPATLVRPSGDGPFPAVLLLHGCHGVSPSTRDWAEWFRARGYVALIVDSWAARNIGDGCVPTAPDPPSTERFDDAIGGLRFLQGEPYVDRARIGAVGWSNGGVFAMSLVNGPSLERARARGVTIPEPGIQASVALYPGGCYSLIQERAIRPLLVLIGDADDWTDPAECRAMVEAMRQRGAEASIVLYPGAVHYFDVEGQPRVYLPEVVNRNRPGGCCGATVGHDAAAAADAHRRVEEFFGYHLRGR